MTLREFLQKKGIEKNLTKLLAETIPLAAIRIREAIEGGDRSHAGSENIHGEKQLALDVQTNNIFCEVLKNSGIVASFASEEMEELVIVAEAEAKNTAIARKEEARRLSDGGAKPFTVVFDPLDGSSLVDVNFAVGSIFGVYPDGNPVGRRGSDQLAAGFVVYGPRTTMVLSAGKATEATGVSGSFGIDKAGGVHEFFLNQDGQFYLAKENLKISDEAKYFAPGNLRACKERDDYKKLLDYWVSNGYTLRYSGGMVPDLNHIFLKGNGIFTYPLYSEAPEGKLRLLYECAPMAFLVEAAGGAATDGKMNLLEKEIRDLHQRTPIYIGSKNEVKRSEEFLSILPVS